MIAFELFPGIVAMMLFCIHECENAFALASDPEGMELCTFHRSQAEDCCPVVAR